MPAGQVIGDLPQGDLSMTEETTAEPYDAGGTGEQPSKCARTGKGSPIVDGKAGDPGRMSAGGPATPWVPIE